MTAGGRRLPPSIVALAGGRAVPERARDGAATAYRDGRGRLVRDPVALHVLAPSDERGSASSAAEIPPDWPEALPKR